MKLVFIFSAMLMVMGCQSREKLPPSDSNPAATNTYSCRDGSGCAGTGVAHAAIAAISLVDGAGSSSGETKIRCVYQIKDQGVSFPCGASTVTISQNGVSSPKRTFRGEIINLQNLSEKNTYRAEILIPGCSQAKIVNPLKVGMTAEVMFTLPCETK